jgi:hypothetical protein
MYPPTDDTYGEEQSPDEQRPPSFVLKTKIYVSEIPSDREAGYHAKRHRIEGNGWVRSHFGLAFLVAMAALVTRGPGNRRMGAIGGRRRATFGVRLAPHFTYFSKVHVISDRTILARRQRPARAYRIDGRVGVSFECVHLNDPIVMLIALGAVRDAIPVWDIFCVPCRGRGAGIAQRNFEQDSLRPVHHRVAHRGRGLLLLRGVGRHHA